ncbi:hypothetical protein JCM17960_34940 [Magnetospira thiophila]
MAQINLMLQGKGGVGKSFVAGLLAQYHMERGAVPLCFDTDPVNATFAGFPAYNVERVRLGETADEVNPRCFDGLLEKIVEASEEAVVVVDNGAATFLPFVSYAAENAALEILTEAGHEVRIHSVLTGGQAFDDTLLGLSQVLERFPSAPIVVWLNEYFGRVEKRSGGKTVSFEESGLYRKNMARIIALVRLPELRRETFGFDIETMLKARLGFAEAMTSGDFNLMARQRLRMVWGAVREAMDKAQL